jgi:hypothetical protein
MYPACSYPIVNIHLVCRSLVSMTAEPDYVSAVYECFRARLALSDFESLHPASGSGQKLVVIWNEQLNVQPSKVEPTQKTLILQNG